MNKTFLLVLRTLLGIGLVVFGANKFLGFLPMPSMPAEASSFMGALAATGYMLPLIGAVEIVAGILFLANRYVPLALVLFAPVLVNILLFHLFLDLKGILPGLFMAVVVALLALRHVMSFLPLLRSK